jgi:hypothetical protein
MVSSGKIEREVMVMQRVPDTQARQGHLEMRLGKFLDVVDAVGHWIVLGLSLSGLQQMEDYLSILGIVLVPRFVRGLRNARLRRKLVSDLACQLLSSVRWKCFARNLVLQILVQRGLHMIKRLFETLMVAGCLLLSACIVMNSSSISESTGGRSAVSAEYSDYGILHLTAPVTLTANANTALAAKCQSGLLSDVQTELTTREWFGIVQYYTVTANGNCK